MMPVKGPVSQKALPINAVTFYNALRAVWSRPEGRAGGPHAKLAIAVSGGVDSMALATLCRQLVKYQFSTQVPEFKFTAFVVDHGAREGSKEEAERVLERVRKMGIRGAVLTLNWPSGVIPSQLPNFESQARALRYKALGEACKERGLSSILLGHHAEDQAETVLMKLARGHGGGGLAGMAASSDIPECYGMHGIHQSGGWEPQFSTKEKRRHQKDQESYEENREEDEFPTDIHGDDMKLTRASLPKGSIPVERGGITIHRPLLNFSKAQLIATCTAAKTIWEEDVTNQDRTLTERNAIRYLLQQRQLPKALQTESLIALSKRWQERTHHLESRAELAWRANEIKLLDVRSGGVIVRFQKKLHGSKRVPEKYLHLNIQKAMQKGARMIRRAVELVSPQEVIELPRLRRIAHHIFPDIDDPDFSDADRELVPQTSFTACGVHFQRIFSPQEQEDPSGAHDESHISQKGEKAQKLGTYLDEKYVWMLTRQPYGKTSPGPELVIPPDTQRPGPLTYARDSGDERPKWTWKRNKVNGPLEKETLDDAVEGGLPPSSSPPEQPTNFDKAYPRARETTIPLKSSSTLRHHQRREFHHSSPYLRFYPNSQDIQSRHSSESINPTRSTPTTNPNPASHGLAHHASPAPILAPKSKQPPQPHTHHPHKRNRKHHLYHPRKSRKDGFHRTPSTALTSAPWHLWDGRFWIRVSNPTDRDVVVRPLRPDDLFPFRRYLEQHVSRKTRAQFDEVLSAAAPGKVRWTLPVLAWSEQTERSEGSEHSVGSAHSKHRKLTARPLPSKLSKTPSTPSTDAHNAQPSALDLDNIPGSGGDMDTCPVIAFPTLNFSIYPPPSTSFPFPETRGRAEAGVEPESNVELKRGVRPKEGVRTNANATSPAIGQMYAETGEKRVEWQVRYKKISIPPDREGRERQGKVLVQ